MFLNNYNWCKCWNRCKPQYDNIDKKDAYACKCQEQKICHLEPYYNSNNNYCQTHHRFNKCEGPSFNYNGYEYSNFRYYDQYGSFNQLDTEHYKYNNMAEYSNNCRQDKNEDKCNHSKHNTCHSQCQPTMFACFPINKY